MNARRRKAISNAIEAYLSKETEAREALRDALQEIWDEENSAYENLPESIQDSEKGEAMEEDLDAIDDFITALDDDPYYDELDELRSTIGLED